MSATGTTERKSFLPLRLRSTTVVGSSNIPTTSRPTTLMSLNAQNDSKSLYTVGDRVLVNGLKIGTLRYVGTVKFAPGLFYGVELDEPEGKHDGQVNDFRYFQCQTNHGVFVPYDKVVLVPRERTLSTHRSISRLKPPTVTRSMTLSSANSTRSEQISIKTSSAHVQLPDIIPNPLNPTQPISIIKTTNDPIPADDYETMTPTEESRIISQPVVHSQPPAIDEAPETIEADFTDSISILLHQLQPEQKTFLTQPRPSLTISEGSIDDDGDEQDDDDTDGLDSVSVTESSMSEKIQMIRRLSFIHDSSKSVQTDLSFDTNDNMFAMKHNLADSKLLSNSNKSLTSSTTSINNYKLTPTEKKTTIYNKRPSIPTSGSITKKEPERKASMSLLVNPNTSRRLSLIPPKKAPPSMVRQNQINLPAPLSSQTKLNHSLSSSNSIDDNSSDVTPNQHKPSKTAVQPTRTISHSIDFFTSDKKSTSSRHSLDTIDQQLLIQKVIIQSLESTNEHLKKQYRYLLNQFDVMCILIQYHITNNDQIKQQYELKLAKTQLANNHTKTSIEQLRIAHKNEVATLEEQYCDQIDGIEKLHKEQMIKYQQQIDQLLNDKNEFEHRCVSLQEQVDRYLEEMANSEHADPLLRRVETLEKDKGSLQTVLEIRTQELTQLRTKINEQVFQREDQLVLQKRIDMAENRNQDLVCLLRNWQLNEKAVTVECDQLKEQLAQIERDNRQLTFENETLLYRLRQKPSSISVTPTTKITFNLSSTERAHSYSSLIVNPTNESNRPTRSLSFNHISNR